MNLLRAAILVAAAATSASAENAHELRPAGDLSGIGAGDFQIRFTLRTQSQLDSAIVSQRGTCNHGVFWDVRMSAKGALGIETDGGSYTVLVADDVKVNDGKAHAIAITRRANKLSASIDGHVRATADSDASFGQLAALSVGTDPCVDIDGTRKLDGQVTSVELVVPTGSELAR